MSSNKGSSSCNTEVTNTGTPERPQPVSHLVRPVTPPPPTSSPHVPVIQAPSDSSAFEAYSSSTNQETGRGSESVANTGTPERPQPVCRLVRPVIPPPPPPPSSPHVPVIQAPSDSSASEPHSSATNKETGGGSESGNLVVCSRSPVKQGCPEKEAAGSGSGIGQGSSSSNLNTSNPSSPIRPTETLTPQRPRPISHHVRPFTPPPPSSSPHRPLPLGGSSAFARYNTPNQGTALVLVDGTGGGSGSGALVVHPGSPAKRSHPEKEAMALGSGPGQGSEDENRHMCSICGKGFVSEKAVFGHMRLHRNRGWKGANPPPVFNAGEEFADVPGVNLSLVVREEVEAVEDGRATAEAAESSAASEAEEAEKILAVERRRGIRIDLNINLWTQDPDNTDA